ncbi:hypothetical protein [Salinirubrum litoreum]|uniref:Uncharacterized protein n=1 Tax=Salinirubrum litoreum TaxID=1126234 RepID=A0ABD5RFR4_9EURY|nr:hypothetical protein [Salinirubrum litoreum]
MGLFDYLAGLFGREGGSSDGDRWTGGAADDSADTDTDIVDVAETFAADTPEHEFDFSLASLDRLDEYVTTVDSTGSDGDADAATESDRDGLPEGPSLHLGSYFGEVLVRQFDGEWVRRDDVRVVIPAGSTSVAVSPFHVADVALRSDPQFARTAEQIRDRVDDTEDEEPGLELDLDSAGSVDSGDTTSETTDAVDSDATDDHRANDGESPFPTVPFDAGMDLDTAHERTLATFDDAGYRVTAGDLLNSMPENPVAGVGKLFLFYTPTEMYTGVVYVGQWDEPDTQAVVSLARYLMADDDLDGLHVVSATAPPPAVTYLTDSHPRAAFALDARREVEDGPAFSAESAPRYADLGADLLTRHADLRVDRTDTGTLARLDEFVLDELRPVADRDATHEGYVPREALLAVGALAGEVMRHGLERELPVTVEWGTDDDIATTGVVLQITTADADGALTVNPVGKAFKLFESGTEESLADLYETVLAVVDREIGDSDA